MVLEVLIGQVLLRVSGGKYTAESSVTFEDVRQYLPAAVNYALNHSYWTNVGIDGDHEIPGFFLSEYADLPITTVGGRDRISLPYKKINIGNNRGIRYMVGNNMMPINPAPQGMMLNSTWNKMFGDIPLYSETQDFIEIINKPVSLTSVTVGAVTDVSELSVTDDLPIPAGYEAQVIDILVKFFTDSRFTPKDYIIDGKDISA